MTSREDCANSHNQRKVGEPTVISLLYSRIEQYGQIDRLIQSYNAVSFLALLKVGMTVGVGSESPQQQSSSKSATLLFSYGD